MSEELFMEGSAKSGAPIRFTANPQVVQDTGLRVGSDNLMRPSGDLSYQVKRSATVNVAYSTIWMEETGGAFEVDPSLGTVFYLNNTTEDAVITFPKPTNIDMQETEIFETVLVIFRGTDVASIDWSSSGTDHVDDVTPINPLYVGEANILLFTMSRYIDTTVRTIRVVETGHIFTEKT